MKTKAIYFGVLAIVITIGFAAISMDSGQIKALSDTQLVKLQGGVTFCVEDCKSSYCKCETHDCEDIECTRCDSYEGDVYCKGNDGDGADVTGCYKTDTESNSCTDGDNILTNCQVDVYSSTDTNCSGTPTIEDDDFYGNDCS